MINNKFRLEIEIDRESNEITLSSVMFPPELQEEIRRVCQKYYNKHLTEKLNEPASEDLEQVKNG